MRILDKEKESYVNVEDVLIWIETNLVQPFEGILKTEDEKEKEIHRKITDYNREKFNKLGRILRR